VLRNLGVEVHNARQIFWHLKLDILVPAPKVRYLSTLDKTFVLFLGAYHAVSLFRSPCKESWSPSQQRFSKRVFCASRHAQTQSTKAISKD